MDIFTIAFWVIAIILTAISLIKDKKKTFAAMKKSKGMFYVVKGEVLLRKNDESSILRENQVFITEPALLSMETTVGARLMGVQIKAQTGE